MGEINEQKYKGFCKSRILDIQKVHMPQYSQPYLDGVDLTDMAFNTNISNAVKNMAEREAHNSDIYVLCEMAMKYLETMRQERNISGQIKDKSEVIAELLSNGKHVELCENKDGLRIISMDRKVVK